MHRILVTTLIALGAMFANAGAQQWQATTLGPGSQPGTILIEINGSVSDTGECGPDPVGNACEVGSHFVQGSITPCVDTPPDAICGERGYNGGFREWVLPGDEFSIQFEIQEGVTYFIDGFYEFLVYESLSHDGSSCNPAMWCGFVYEMNPDPLMVSAAVPVAESGWSVLKSTYGER